MRLTHMDHAHMHARVQHDLPAFTCTHTHTHTHIRMHIYIHIHTHTHTHTHAHTHTHTHTAFDAARSAWSAACARSASSMAFCQET